MADQIYALVLTGAEDFEIIKRLRIQPTELHDFWHRVAEHFGVEGRFETLRKISGDTVAATWKSKRDFEHRLKEEIFEQESEKAILTELSVATGTGGWSLEFATGRNFWTEGVNLILNRPLDAPPLSAAEIEALVHPEDRAMHRHAVERLLTEGKEFHITYRLIINGNVKHVRSISRAHYGEDGSLKRVFGTVMDETELLRLRGVETSAKRMIESVAAALPEVVFITDLHTEETVYSNKNIAIKLGFGAFEARQFGQGVPISLLHPQDLGKLRQRRDRLSNLADGAIDETEIRLADSSGGWVHLILRSVTFLRDDENRVRQTLTITHDVTALRESQRALEQSEELLERTFQDAPLGIALLSLDGTYEKVNQAYLAICGHTAQDLIGQNILLINSEEEVSLYLDYICQSVSDPHSPPYRREKQTIRKDGAKVWVHLVCSILRDSSGRAVKVVAQCQDITSSKLSADLLREYDYRLQSAIDSLPAGVLMVGQDHEVKLVNPAAAEILDIPISELKQSLIAKPNWRLHHQGQPISVGSHPIYRALAGEAVGPLELKLTTANGKELWIRVSSSPLYRLDEVTPYAAMSTFIDITREVEYRDSLTDSLNRVQELNETLETNQRDLEMQKIHLVEANIHLTQLSITDGLTGLNNSRRCKEYLEERAKEADRYFRPLSIAMIDVDFFKNLNDTYGHVVGDQVLQKVARILESSLRNTDFIGRYGGEEFLVVMPEIDEAGAFIAADRLRARIESELADPYRMTISIGTASVVHGMTRSGQHLIEIADEALYCSKHKGRNRVTLGSCTRHVLDKGV